MPYLSNNTSGEIMWEKQGRINTNALFRVFLQSASQVCVTGWNERRIYVGQLSAYPLWTTPAEWINIDYKQLLTNAVIKVERWNQNSLQINFMFQTRPISWKNVCWHVGACFLWTVRAWCVSSCPWGCPCHCVALCDQFRF